MNRTIRPERDTLERPLPTRSDGRQLTLITLCIAVLVAQVDTSVVNLAARPIGWALGAGVETLQWVVDSYNLVYAALLLTGGLLADLYGRRRVFVTGAVVLTGASLLCALAPNPSALILGRAASGLGAALLLPASLALVRVVWPDPVERGKALGIWAGCNGLALAIGPTLGGLMIDAWGWRSIFYAVLPMTVAAAALAAVSVPESRDPAPRRFDAFGQILGAAALGAVSMAAIAAGRSPGTALISLLAAALRLALFIGVETKSGAAAMVPLDLFRNPAFSGAMAATAGMTFGMYGVLFLLPLTWQGSGTLDPVGAGLAVMPTALVFVIVSPFSGALAARVGTRAAAAGGVAVIGTGLLLIGLEAGRGSVAAVEPGLVLTGIGMGMATGPLMSAAVGAVPAARAGTAAALINVARMAGATLGVAALGAVHSAWGGAATGLTAAMCAGGGVQLLAAGVGWHAMQRRSDAGEQETV